MIKKPMTLHDRISLIDHIQARRFGKLDGRALELATEGIRRHLKACAAVDVAPEALAVKEIIDGALRGRPSYARAA